MKVAEGLQLDLPRRNSATIAFQLLEAKPLVTARLWLREELQTERKDASSGTMKTSQRRTNKCCHVDCHSCVGLDGNNTALKKGNDNPLHPASETKQQDNSALQWPT